MLSNIERFICYFEPSTRLDRNLLWFTMVDKLGRNDVFPSWLFVRSSSPQCPIFLSLYLSYQLAIWNISKNHKPTIKTPQPHDGHRLPPPPPTRNPIRSRVKNRNRCTPITNSLPLLRQLPSHRGILPTNQRLLLKYRHPLRKNLRIHFEHPRQHSRHHGNRPPARLDAGDLHHPHPSRLWREGFRSAGLPWTR